MSMITRLMSMAIPSNPTTHLLSIDSKPSNLYRASSIRSSNFQFKAQTRDDALIFPTQRRSGNYKPPVWDFDFIHSLSNESNKEERYLKRASKLMGEVKMMLDEQGLMDHVVQRLDLIDDLQRLGISYHFKDKIERILNSIYHEEYYPNDDLHSTSLRFRLLRQHGFSVSQDVFNRFKNDGGDDFDASLANDTRGLLQLYEASFMLTEGEDTLELARAFATRFLEKKIHNHDDQYLSLLVRNALDVPLHWRIPKLNARWFIDAYEKRSKNMNPIVLELAKLDFNIEQAKHQEELRHVSSWWEQSRLAKKMPFARDMLVKCYFFAFFVHLDPRFGYSRIMATKVNVLVTIIDDAFDVYATMEELKLFVDVVQSWDIEAAEKLPSFMQTYFLALNNFINEVAYDVHKEQGLFIIQHLRKSWEDLFQIYLQHAELYSKGVTPKFEDYVSNACSSSSAFALLSHAYFLVTNPIEHEDVQSLYNRNNIIRYSGLILRLANDLGTSADEMERGDVPKSVQCYMHETGASVDEAREHMRLLIYETWKKLNGKVAADALFKPEFVRILADLGRMAQYVYKHENSPGIQYAHMKENISSFLFEPIDV